MVADDLAGKNPGAVSLVDKNRLLISALRCCISPLCVCTYINK